MLFDNITGKKVRIKLWEEMLIDYGICNKEEDCIMLNNGFSNSMKPLCGYEATICKVLDNYGKDGITCFLNNWNTDCPESLINWKFSDEMFYYM